MSVNKTKIILNIKRLCFVLFMFIALPFLVVYDTIKMGRFPWGIFKDVWNPLVWWESSNEVAIRGKWRIATDENPDEVPELVFKVGGNVFSCHRKEDVAYMVLKYNAKVILSPDK